MSDLINRLRHYCYEPEFAEAADALEAQAKEIAELTKMVADLEGVRQLDVDEYNDKAAELLSQQEKLCSYIIELGRTRELCDQQAKGIAELQLGAESQAFELVQQAEEIILLNENVQNAMVLVKHYKALCDQLGHALYGHCAPFLGHEEEHRLALEQWMESK